MHAYHQWRHFLVHAVPILNRTTATGRRANWRCQTFHAFSATPGKPAHTVSPADFARTCYAVNAWPGRLPRTAGALRYALSERHAFTTLPTVMTSLGVNGTRTDSVALLNNLALPGAVRTTWWFTTSNADGL